MINTNNNFTYGEIGDVLNGNKNNQIYQNSAISITNGIIGEAGTIRAVESFSGSDVTLGEDVVSVLTTKYDFYVVVSTTKIHTVNGGNIIMSVDLTDVITDPEKTNITVFADRYVGIVETGITQFYRFNEGGADLMPYDFLSDINPPLDNRKKARVDIHRVYEVEEVRTKQDDGSYYTARRKTIERLQSLEDPLVKVVGNKLEIQGLGGSVARMYGEPLNQFRLTNDEHTDGEVTEANVSVGDIIVNFPNGIPSDLIFKDVIPTFTGDEEDNGITYYTNFEAPDGEGRLVRGDLVDLNGKIVAIAEFQSRLVFSTDNTMYFSGINQYQNFTNYTDDDDPFWIKIPPVDNQPTAIVSLLSSRTLFILTNKGIYTIGTGQTLSPRTSTIDLSTDTGSTKKATMVDGNLFFVGIDGRLYSVQELRDTAGTKMYSYIVEKYNFDTSVTYITNVRYEKRNRLLVLTGETKLHIYDIIGTNDFRRTTVETTEVITKAWGLFDKLYANNKYYVNSNVNKTMTIELHPPYTMTQEGTMLNDKSIYIDSITLNILGDPKVFVNGKHIPKKTDDPVYTMKTHTYVKDGMVITIESNQHAELLAIEYNHNIAGRY